MLATIALYSKIIGYLKQCDESFSGFVRMIFTIVRDLKEFIVVLFVIFALATHVFVLRAHARGSYGEVILEVFESLIQRCDPDWPHYVSLLLSVDDRPVTFLVYFLFATLLCRSHFITFRCSNRESINVCN